MIPLWLTTACSIILLIVILYNLITSDINWKDINWKLLQSTIKLFAEITLAVITGFCIAVITLSIAQRLPW